MLPGEALARAYADMDVFVFPSHTDTYGNVVLEAMASGVPAVVTGSGGPKYPVQSGETGFVACVVARAHARQFSWDHVFEAEVYSAYGECLRKSTAASARGRQPGLARA